MPVSIFREGLVNGDSVLVLLLITRDSIRNDI